MLETLFKFPIIMIDGENEERKEKLAMDDSEVDMIEGIAELPYYDFLGLSDAWIPNEESFRNALDNKSFNACRVHFSQSGSYTVPWTRAKFKKEFQKFLDQYEPKKEKMVTFELVKKKEGE